MGLNTDQSYEPNILTLTVPEMAIFCLELPSNSANKRCRFLWTVLRDPFSSCHTCKKNHLSCSTREEEETPITDFDDVQDVLVSMIRSRAMEAKYRRKGSILLTENYSFVHPTSGELMLSRGKQQQEISKVDEETDDFESVNSSLSSCYTAAVEESEAFFSVKTNFTCCSSLKDLEFVENRWSISEVVDTSETRRRAIIQEVCHCEGWPFGLCRKALLLPPLPKSPSESWSWCKGFPKDTKTSRNVNNRLIENFTAIAF